MIRSYLAIVTVFVFVPVQAADPVPAEVDPWEGKPRSEIVQLLGEPAKSKNDRYGRETLTYKFFRIDPNARLGPEVMLLQVPGIGLVGRVDEAVAAGPSTFEPPTIDEQGRPSGGGVPAGTDSASSSYDPKTGEVTRSGLGTENPPVKGKVKVRFVLDAGGRVEEWSVSGKK